MDYEEYEKDVEVIVEENEKYLECFYDDLVEHQLKPKTIGKHINNVAFYINDFLNYYEPTEMKEGCYKIDEFLGDWFIRKAMWSNATTTKENGASIKKFYKCMLEHHYIEKKDYDELCYMIKNNMSDWIESVNNYNNVDCFG